MTNTTALLRRIAAEEQIRRNAAWETRHVYGRSGERKRPRWAVDTLLASATITPGQHEAARRYVCILERAQEGGRSDSPKVDASTSDAHARAWDMAINAQLARSVRSWVLAASKGRPSTKRVLDRLCAFPAPTFEAMRRMGRGRLSPTETERQCRNVLEVLETACLELGVLPAGRGFAP